MKAKVPFAFLLVALSVGFLLGTKSGRAKRDQLLVRLGCKQAEEEIAIDLAERAIDEAGAATATTS